MSSMWIISAIFLTTAYNVHGLIFDEPLTHILNEIREIREDMKVLQQKMDRLLDTNFVGFSAHSKNSRHYSHGQTVVYDTVTYNTNGAYSTSTGHFTCPQSGMYFFSVAVSTNNDHHCSMMLYRQTTAAVQTAFVAAFADKSNNDQGSISYVVECSAGDIMFVKQENETDGVMDGDRGEFGGPLNAFTGFMIAQIF